MIFSMNLIQASQVILQQLKSTFFIFTSILIIKQKFRQRQSNVLQIPASSPTLLVINATINLTRIQQKLWSTTEPTRNHLRGPPRPRRLQTTPTNRNGKKQQNRCRIRCIWQLFRWRRRLQYQTIRQNDIEAEAHQQQHVPGPAEGKPLRIALQARRLPAAITP